MRQVDKTPVICKVCGEEYTAAGFRSHIQHRHKMNTDMYVSKYGEFRPKVIRENELDSTGDFSCGECDTRFKSHKKLMHHITTHGLNYTAYHVKHSFSGKHPTCDCGCGFPVKIIKGGIIENGVRVYARKFLSGHNTSTQVGVQTRTHASRMKMRQSAVNRIKRNNNRFSPITPKAELEIKEYVNTVYGGFDSSDSTLLYGREVDMVNHEIKLGIEYNGMYFHSDKFRDRQYHLSKMKEMETIGYRLIYIWEDWWVRRQEIVKSMLSAILGKTQNKIHARLCTVREIDDKTAREFLRQTHIQGECVSKVRLGLFYGDTLVSVMTFGGLRRYLGNKNVAGSWELLRFSTKLHTTVTGGASKLFTFFIRNYMPKYILSYANRDWSNGVVYGHLGFSLIGETPPGYFYCKGKRRFSRSMFTKDKLIRDGFDANKSESLIMNERGYMKIWDTGNLKFEWHS